jgi:hypothetical protein
MGAVGKAWTCLPKRRERGVRAPAVTRHQDDARPESGKPSGGNLSDAGRGAGDDDGLAVNGSLLRAEIDSNAGTFYTNVWLLAGSTNCRECGGLVEPAP